MATFSIKNALSFGWDKMKKNFLLFFLVILVMIGLSIIGEIAERIFIDVGVLVVLAAIVVSFIIQLGFYRILLNIVDGKKSDLKDLFSQPSLFPDYLIGTILYILIVVGGLILLIVPGIIWAIKYQYYGLHIVDKKEGPINALKASAKITQGRKWDLFLFWLACLGVNILGLLALIVGLFATIPTTAVANAYIYRTLSKGKR